MEIVLFSIAMISIVLSSAMIKALERLLIFVVTVHL